PNLERFLTFRRIPVSPAVSPAVSPICTMRSMTNTDELAPAHAPFRAMPVLTTLNHDWKRITVGLAELRTVSTWGLPGGAVDTLDDVLTRCGFHGRPGARRAAQPPRPVKAVIDPKAADRCLLALVERARTQQLAGRIV